MSHDDDHYRSFAQALEGVLDSHGESLTGTALITRQRKQLRDLISTETKFRETLIGSRRGVATYKAFIKMICDQKRNILAARPYFRERQSVFTRHISKALKARNDKALYRYRFNWTFVEWVLKHRPNPPQSLQKLAKEIVRLRKDILEQMMPFVISQARGFWKATPRSHLSYMDIVQIQAQGLLLAVDKFVPPNDTGWSEARSLFAYRKFRAVAIGIMRRDRVNEYSATLLHFYPKDRAKMYRANKLMRRQVGPVDWDEMASKVNDQLSDPEHGLSEETTGDELAALLAGGSTVSGDTRPEGDEGTDLGDTVLEATDAGEQFRPDAEVESKQALDVLRVSTGVLLLREQKMLKLQGVRA